MNNSSPKTDPCGIFFEISSLNFVIRDSSPFNDSHSKEFTELKAFIEI